MFIASLPELASADSSCSASCRVAALSDLQIFYSSPILVIEIFSANIQLITERLVSQFSGFAKKCFSWCLVIFSWKIDVYCLLKLMLKKLCFPMFSNMTVSKSCLVTKFIILYGITQVLQLLQGEYTTYLMAARSRTSLCVGHACNHTLKMIPGYSDSIRYGWFRVIITERVKTTSVII